MPITTILSLINNPPFSTLHCDAGARTLQATIPPCQVAPTGSRFPLAEPNRVKIGSKNREEEKSSFLFCLLFVIFDVREIVMEEEE